MQIGGDVTTFKVPDGADTSVGNSPVRICDKAFYARPSRSAPFTCRASSEKAAKKGKPSRLPVRVYPCDVCDGWHLTAKPVRGRETALGP